jgi:hypothetical protein
VGGLQFGWGRESTPNTRQSQFELRQRWEVTKAGTDFQRIFHTGLLRFVGRVVEVFSPPQSVGLLFEFGPGTRNEFMRLVDATAFPPKTLNQALGAPPAASQSMIPDDPGVGNRDAWWRRMAAGAAIGASFREQGTDTILHIAFNQTLCDVHVDRNGFVVTDGGYAHWNLNGLLRHLTMDLAGDKVPWVLTSMTYVNRQKRPIFEATLGPWLAIDLPSKDMPGRTDIKVGLMVVGTF